MLPTPLDPRDCQLDPSPLPTTLILSTIAGSFACGMRHVAHAIPSSSLYTFLVLTLARLFPLLLPLRLSLLFFRLGINIPSTHGTSTLSSVPLNHPQASSTLASCIVDRTPAHVSYSLNTSLSHRLFSCQFSQSSTVWNLGSVAHAHSLPLRGLKFPVT